jgi:two-component system response regulator PilR (NtrC family)
MQGAFVPVNCGAIPQELVESELFGHKKGNSTGTVRDKPGLFQAADGGTLFLDEVADPPLPA